MAKRNNVGIDALREEWQMRDELQNVLVGSGPVLDEALVVTLRRARAGNDMELWAQVFEIARDNRIRYTAMCNNLAAIHDLEADIADLEPKEEPELKPVTSRKRGDIEVGMGDGGS